MRGGLLGDCTPVSPGSAGFRLGFRTVNNEARLPPRGSRGAALKVRLHGSDVRSRRFQTLPFFFFDEPS